MERPVIQNYTVILEYFFYQISNILFHFACASWDLTIANYKLTKIPLERLQATYSQPTGWLWPMLWQHSQFWACFRFEYLTVTVKINLMLQTNPSDFCETGSYLQDKWQQDGFVWILHEQGNSVWHVAVIWWWVKRDMLQVMSFIAQL